MLNWCLYAVSCVSSSGATLQKSTPQHGLVMTDSIPDCWSEKGHRRDFHVTRFRGLEDFGFNLLHLWFCLESSVQPAAGDGRALIRDEYPFSLFKGTFWVCVCVCLMLCV